MRILYYDCFAGISGDMNLGAMIDLGVDADYLVNELKKLGLNNEYEIKVGRESRKGIEGTKVDVILKGHDHCHEHHDNCEGHKCNQNDLEGHCHEEHNHDNMEDHCHGHNHNHEHCHKHDHSHDSHEQHVENHHHHSADHIHRNLKDIENIINSSKLSDNVKKISLNIFMKVAEAESKVHGKPLYEVHFHEVGAIDSIVDIVGAAICLEYLKVDKVMASSIELGGGFVKCAHGLIPVPAPATVEILKGIPVKSGIVPFETTTPTGAAILAANVEEFTNNVDFIIEKVAYGVGGRDTEIPNVLRVYLGKKKLES